MAYSVLKYPLDRTGVASTNLITKEEHAITGTAQNKVVVLNYGPFFTEGLLVYDQYNNLLSKGSQYVAANLMADETASTGKEVCAYLVITDANVKNKVYITHQVLGGPYSLSVTALMEAIATLSLDNRTVSWGDVIAKPELFKPGSHYHDVGDVYGFEYIVLALSEIADAIDRSTSAGAVDLTPITEAIATLQASLSTYLKITDANATFLKIADAANTYVTSVLYNTTMTNVTKTSLQLRNAVGGINSAVQILTNNITLTPSDHNVAYLYNPLAGTGGGTMLLPSAKSTVYDTEYFLTWPTILLQNISHEDLFVATQPDEYFWMRRDSNRTDITLCGGQSMMLARFPLDPDGKGVWVPMWGSGMHRFDDYHNKAMMGARTVRSLNVSTALTKDDIGSYILIYGDPNTTTITMPPIASAEIGQGLYIKNATTGTSQVIPYSSNGTNDSRFNMLLESTVDSYTLNQNGYVKFIRAEEGFWYAMEFDSHPVNQGDLTALDTKISTNLTTETNHYNDLSSRINAIDLSEYVNAINTGTKLISTNNGLCNQCAVGQTSGYIVTTWSLYKTGKTIGLQRTSAQCTECSECNNCSGGTNVCDTCGSTD